MTDYYARHSATLAKAVDACHKRYSWTAYPESPSSKIHGQEKPREGKARFEAMLGRDYPLQQSGEIGRTGTELSPYTGDGHRREGRAVPGKSPGTLRHTGGRQHPGDHRSLSRIG